LETVRKDFVRPDQTLMRRYRDLLREYSPSCLVTDAQKRMGALSAGWRCVSTSDKAVGPAMTVNLSVDNLVDCMPVLADAQPGDFLVLACHGALDTAMWGALVTRLCQQIGVVAGLVDGSVRDVDEIRDLGFPLWYRDTNPRPSPTAVHNRTEPVQVNVPVPVGDQVINPGDILMADEIGIVVVPCADAEAVLDAVAVQMEKEAEVRRRIESGQGVRELLAEFGHL
jgi:4-hydroxy-4-methyl-2-oxoglutarate aldolase